MNIEDNPMTDEQIIAELVEALRDAKRRMSINLWDTDDIDAALAKAAAHKPEEVNKQEIMDAITAGFVQHESVSLVADNIISTLTTRMSDPVKFKASDFRGRGE